MAGKTSDQEFHRGQQVAKLRGDYMFQGEVVAAFQKRSGLWRYVVEDDRGLLFIFSGKHLELLP